MKIMVGHEIREMTAEEEAAYTALIDDFEEPTPAWDISQGEYIPKGFLLARDGVTYECLVGHYAAWNKQPPNDEYWRAI